MTQTRKSGFLLVDKPTGWTSFDVCARLRRVLGVKKIGHTGTLDPFATGLLVVAVGKCTKFIPLLNKDEKSYRATFTLGATTETLDTESEQILCTKGVRPTEGEIVEALEKRVGTHPQVPPKYSALKQGGKRLYARARAGEDVVVAPRPATLKAYELIEYVYPAVVVDLQVGAGFYVRSLARDVAADVGTLGHCTALRRTAVGAMQLADATTVEAQGELIDPRFVLPHLPRVGIPPLRVGDFSAGRAFDHRELVAVQEGEKFLVEVAGRTIGVGEKVCGKVQPRVVM